MKKLLTILLMSMFLFSLVTISAREITCSDNGVVSIWKFDEVSGTTAIDECGIQDGNLFGEPERVTGKYGNALLFNTTNYVDVQNNSLYQMGSNNFSFSFWIKTTQNTSAGSPIIDSWDSVGDSEYLIGQRYGLLYIYMTDEINYPELYSTTPINDDEFHNIIVIKEGTNISAYIDGSLEFNSDESLGNINNNRNVTIAIGSDDYSPLRSFSGIVDEIVIMNKSLSQSQVEEYYAEEEVITEEDTGLIQGSGVIYEVMSSAGAGLGLFMVYLGISLPVLLIMIAIVSIILIIGIKIAKVISDSFQMDKISFK